MISSALKKLAQQHDMHIAHGIAYGSLSGYAATLSEGSGWKMLQLTTNFPDTNKLTELQMTVNSRELSKEFRVQELTFARGRITIAFRDNPGTLKRIEAFLAWFLPLLDTAGATRVNICTECGGQITAGCWKLIGGAAYYLHEGCAEHIRQSLSMEDEQRRQEDTGSYVTGLAGALIGAALGAIVWAIVLNVGYVASVVGLLIGWLAEKGYELLHGKQGKAKIAILVISIIFGVLLGTFAADAFTLAGWISDGELSGYTYSDIPWLIGFLMESNSDYVSGTLSNVAMGLLFAALGVFSLLRKAGNEVSSVKYIDLN